MLFLTQDALLMCEHPPGTVSIRATQRLVTVSGRRVLVETDPQGRSIGSCPYFNPTAGIKPCTTTLRVQVGYSSLIRINGKRVCLDTVEGLTNGHPPGGVKYKVHNPGQQLVSSAL